MRLRAAISALATAAAIAALVAEAGFAMGGKPKDTPVGTGVGLVVLQLNSRPIPLPWIYATVADRTYKVFAATIMLETFVDWPTLPIDGHQVIIDATLAEGASPPFTRKQVRRLAIAYSWGPGRATARAAWDERQLAEAKWLDVGEMTPARWKATLSLPKGALGSRDVVLQLDVDTKKAPPAQ